MRILWTVICIPFFLGFSNLDIFGRISSPLNSKYFEKFNSYSTIDDRKKIVLLYCCAWELEKVQSKYDHHRKNIFSFLATVLMHGLRWWWYLPLTLLSVRRRGLKGRRRKRREVEERQARQELRRQARMLPQVQLSQGCWMRLTVVNMNGGVGY